MNKNPERVENFETGERIDGLDLPEEVIGKALYDQLRSASISKGKIIIKKVCHETRSITFEHLKDSNQ